MADKTKVIAVTVIHRTVKPGVRGDASKGIAPIKPEVQIVKPGTIFLVDATEYAELSKAGAIRLPEKDEKVAVGIENVAVPEEAPAEKKAAAPKPTARVKPGKAAPKAAETTDANDLV